MFTILHLTMTIAKYYNSSKFIRQKQKKHNNSIRHVDILTGVILLL